MNGKYIFAMLRQVSNRLSKPFRVFHKPQADITFMANKTPTTFRASFSPIAAVVVMVNAESLPTGVFFINPTNSALPLLFLKRGFEPFFSNAKVVEAYVFYLSLISLWIKGFPAFIFRRKLSSISPLSRMGDVRLFAMSVDARFTPMLVKIGAVSFNREVIYRENLLAFPAQFLRWCNFMVRGHGRPPVAARIRPGLQPLTPLFYQKEAAYGL